MARPARKQTPKTKSPRKRSRKPRHVTPDDIVDLALAKAEAVGWGDLNLTELAGSLGMAPADLRSHFRDKDAIANAWFRQAQDAMLANPPRGFANSSVRDRLEILLGRYFDALAPHRAVTAQMLSAKLWYAHPHHYVPMVFNLSRLIQWLRDAALMTATGRQKQLEEIGLTMLFLATLQRWCRDGSDGQEKTKAFIGNRLGNMDKLAERLFGRGTGNSS